MQVVAYSQAKDRWVELMDRVADDRVPLVITRDEAPAVVLMSLEDYESFEETAYLLRSPKNARRLMESIAELEQGGGHARELAE